MRQRRSALERAAEGTQPLMDAFSASAAKVIQVETPAEQNIGSTSIGSASPRAFSAVGTEEAAVGTEEDDACVLLDISDADMQAMFELQLEVQKFSLNEHAPPSLPSSSHGGSRCKAAPPPPESRLRLSRLDGVG